MKTRTILTFVMILIAGILYSQTCVLKWTQNNGKSGSSKESIFDYEWGRVGKKAQGPFLLAIHYQGRLVVKQEAFDVLQKPSWGDGTQTFGETLPVVPKSVRQYIVINEYPWFGIADTVPADDPARGYECKTNDGKIYQGLTLQTYVFWSGMGIMEWRPWNPNPNKPRFKILNPEWESNQAEIASAKNEWNRIIRTTFVQTAQYMFPTFKLGENVRWYMKCNGDDDWLEYPVDENNPLAGNGGWIRHRQGVRSSDMKSWEAFYLPAIYLDTPEKKVKKILGM